MNSTIVVTGTLGYDVIMDFPGRFADRIMPDKLHAISLSFLVETMKKNFGGTAGNIAYSLKLLGMNPQIVSAAGNDFAPYAQFLQKHRIPRTNIVIDKKLATGVYSVITDLDDNQIGSFYIGATVRATALQIKKVVRPAFAIIAPTLPSAMNSYVRQCIQLKIPYLFDPAFQIESFSREDLLQGIKNACMCIGNDYEIELMQRKLGLTHAQLKKMVPILITTLGAKGSIIEAEGKTDTIPAAKVKKVVDPTGAGDAYRSGFIAGYLLHKSMEECGRMGAVAAAYVVETYGTMQHHYTQQQFWRRYAK